MYSGVITAMLVRSSLRMLSSSSPSVVMRSPVHPFAGSDVTAAAPLKLHHCRRLLFSTGTTGKAPPQPQPQPPHTMDTSLNVAPPPPPQYLTLKTSGLRVPLSFEHESLSRQFSLQEITDSALFASWWSQMDTSFSSQHDHQEYSLDHVTVQSVDKFKSSQKIGFIKLQVSVRHRETGVTVPGICLLRGASVACLCLLRSDQMGELDADPYVVLTEQPRIPMANLHMVEIPAGMLDDSGNFAGKAAEEIKEETGLSLDAEELIDLTEHTGPIAVSCGVLDEQMKFYLYEKRCSEEFIESLRNREAGERNVGEMITVRVEPLDRVMQTCRDSKFWIAMSLYRRYLDNKD